MCAVFFWKRGDQPTVAMWLRTGLLLAVLFQTIHKINGQVCGDKFKNGKEDFVLDIENAVGRGAELISTPPIENVEDCKAACCELPQCNVVLVDMSRSKPTCSLFNCLYKQGLACRFVRKKGFSSFVLDNVYKQHLEAPETAGLTAGPLANAGRSVEVRPGQEVTLSGQESLAQTDATISSYEWSLMSGDAAVVTQATGDRLKVTNLKAGTYVFQLKVTDSEGQSDMTTVSIKVFNEKESDMHCLVAKEVGLCRASFPRWHYNSASARCEEFVYGGCKGNHNNFLSEKECGTACANVKAPTSRSINLPGNEDCSELCDKGQFECENSCCVDRSLECDGKKQCSDGSDEARCSQINETFSSLLKVSFDDNLAICTEPPKAGRCSENRTAWYYNPLQQQCHTFSFTGCHGNDNNFESKELCEKKCEGVTEKAIFAPGRFEELEETESGSIAIAIVLAVSILVLLAVLSFFFLKGRKKRAHQPVATSPPPPADGEVGDDDTVVYRSTTKPV